jgi:hypothetical protein
MPLVSQEGDIKTFEQAEASKRQKLSIAKQRRIPDPLGVIEEATRRHTYHIFNVGPWPQQINTGSTGWVKVPGCPKDKEYVEATAPIMGIVSELTIKDEYEYNRLMSDGWKFAQECVGIGRNRNPKRALTHYGLFASKNAVPTKEELFQAKTMLHATCSDIIREARDLYSMDRKAFSVVVKRNRHFAAAEVLNLNDEPWMVEQTPSQRIKCQYCGSMNDEIAVKCQKCSEVINVERYRMLKDREEEIMTAPREEPRRGPGRPPKPREE